MQARGVTLAGQMPHPESNLHGFGALNARRRLIELESPIDGIQPVSIDVDYQSTRFALARRH
jgi:hypothetical protein